MKELKLNQSIFKNTDTYKHRNKNRAEIKEVGREQRWQSWSHSSYIYSHILVIKNPPELG